MTNSDDQRPTDSTDTTNFAPKAKEEQMARVGEMATIRGGIDLHTENVIGIFGKASDLRAILRRPDGSTLRVKIGDAALGGQVLGIDENTVTLVKNKKVIRLRMPTPALDRLSSHLK